MLPTIRRKAGCGGESRTCQRLMCVGRGTAKTAGVRHRLFYPMDTTFSYVTDDAGMASLGSSKADIRFLGKRCAVADS